MTELFADLGTVFMEYWGSFLHGMSLAHMVKNLPETQEIQVQFLGWEDPLGKGMATHPNILAWRIPMDRGAWWATVHGSQRVRHN